MRLGLSYDDVLLVPKRSPVESRRYVDTSTSIGGISLDVPVISAPMKSVTELGMVLSMSYSGGCGIIHRFQPIKDQIEQVQKVDGPVGLAVGLDDTIDNFLTNTRPDFICLDVAHAHLEHAIGRVEELSEFDIPLMAGTVSTYEAAVDLSEAGADILRVGVGPGSACTTRERAGVGVPQITAIQETAGVEDVDIVADGGITNPGDIVKALMAGADAVIIGGLLASCEESAAERIEVDGVEYKKYVGMASEEVQEELGKDEIYVEGESYLTEVYGSVEHRMTEFKKGIQSGLSYCGGYTIEQARRNAEFMRITAAGSSRSGAYGSSRYD